MGFFKDFSEDLSDAVTELLPEDENEGMVNTLDDDMDNELSKMDNLLDQVSKKVENDEDISVSDKVEAAAVPVAEVKKETVSMDYTQTATTTAVASDENAIITKGMTIKGDLESTGSIDVEGTIVGDITCKGKLTVTGSVNGNSSASEFFADAAKVEGEVATTGAAKIGVGSVVIGNIVATSAVIAGSVKGDIDVDGPVVVDTQAVIMGNIKSRSVQINNGAVIQGFCSQSYADVDVESVFN